jgi:hypothetical protein
MRPASAGPARRAASAPALDAGSPVAAGEPAGLASRLAFALGAMAFIALPIAYQWTFRPSSRPAGSDVLVPLLELGGVVAAAAALLLGRRARSVGERSSGAVWGPRLGGAAIVGYAMAFVVLVSRGA